MVTIKINISRIYGFIEEEKNRGKIASIGGRNILRFSFRHARYLICWWYTPSPPQQHPLLAIYLPLSANIL